MKNEITWFNGNKFIFRYCNANFKTIGKKLFLLETPDFSKGKSFLYNLTELQNSKATLIEKGMYAYLASLRNYFDVYMYDDHTLDIRKIPTANLDTIEANRLLKLENGKINFFFED